MSTVPVLPPGRVWCPGRAAGSEPYRPAVRVMSKLGGPGLAPKRVRGSRVVGEVDVYAAEFHARDVPRQRDDRYRKVFWLDPALRP